MAFAGVRCIHLRGFGLLPPRTAAHPPRYHTAALLAHSCISSHTRATDSKRHGIFAGGTARHFAALRTCVGFHARARRCALVLASATWHFYILNTGAHHAYTTATIQRQQPVWLAWFLARAAYTFCHVTFY